MNVEKGHETVDRSAIELLVKGNVDWVLKGKGQFNGEGRSPKELIDSSFKHLLSLRGVRVLDDGDNSLYQSHLAKMMEHPESTLRTLFGHIWSEWQKNMP